MKKDNKKPERREFLEKASKVSLATIASALLPMSAMGLAKEEISINTSEPIDKSGSVDELKIRMREDIKRAMKKPIDERRWGMVIDLRKCVGCNGCTIACITENKLPPGMAYRPVLTETHGTYPNVSRRFIPRPCMQCDEPPCIEVCPVNATWKRKDGIITIDYNQCIGCRYCITACPYSARSFDSGYFYNDFGGGEIQPYEELPSPEYNENRVREEGSSPIGNVRKCTFCLHRVEKGELPACVLTCMGRATYFGDLNDSKSLVSELAGSPNIMRLKEELGTGPKVIYLT